MSTITTINGTDVISNSRSVINTNFSNLNTDKAELASPTFTGIVTTPAIILSSETASTIASFDASKNIKSLALVTYPSLTELSYVKGVTSALQTQINAKEPTITTLSVAKGGTNKSSWTQYLIPYADTTTSFSQIAIGTTTQVLTSNGAGAAPTFQTLSVSSFLIRAVTDFGSSGRFTPTNTGTGVVTHDLTGVKLLPTTSASSGSSKITWCPFGTGTAGTNAGLFLGSPLFSATLYASDMAAASNTGSLFVGLGAVTGSTSRYTYTDKSIGFKLLKDSGVVTLYATQGNGTTATTSSALTTVVDGDTLDLVLKVNSTTSVDYYWRKNGGALSSATNLTTNMPTDANANIIQFSCSNESTGARFNLNFGASSYER